MVSLPLPASADWIAARSSVPHSTPAPEVVVLAEVASETWDGEMKLEIVLCSTPPEVPAPPTMTALPRSETLKGPEALVSVGDPEVIAPSDAICASGRAL